MLSAEQVMELDRKLQFGDATELIRLRKEWEEANPEVKEAVMRDAIERAKQGESDRETRMTALSASKSRVNELKWFLSQYWREAVKHHGLLYAATDELCMADFDRSATASGMTSTAVDVKAESHASPATPAAFGVKAEPHTDVKAEPCAAAAAAAASKVAARPAAVMSSSPHVDVKTEEDAPPLKKPKAELNEEGDLQIEFAEAIETLKGYQQLYAEVIHSRDEELISMLRGMVNPNLQVASRLLAQVESMRTTKQMTAAFDFPPGELEEPDLKPTADLGHPH